MSTWAGALGRSVVGRKTLKTNNTPGPWVMMIPDGEDTLYWSDKHGWIRSLEDATTFPTRKISELQLPPGGAWIEKEFAKNAIPPSIEPDY